MKYYNLKAIQGCDMVVQGCTWLCEVVQGGDMVLTRWSFLCGIVYISIRIAAVMNLEHL